MSPKLTGTVALVTGASRTTELMSHNTGPVREEIDHFHATTEVLVPEDIADGQAGAWIDRARWAGTRPGGRTATRAPRHARRVKV
jgi:hypothetical protein